MVVYYYQKLFYHIYFSHFFLKPVNTRSLPLFKDFTIFLSVLEVTKGVSAKHIITTPSKFLSKGIAFLTASPVPKGFFWIVLITFLLFKSNLSNSLETTI